MVRSLPFLFVIAFLFFGIPIVPAQTLQVMSYNIHHGANSEEVLTLEEIGRFIKQSGADLVGLQEVDSLCNRSGNTDQMKALAAITGMHYAFVRHFAYDGGAYGLGILSRYPVSEVRNNRITSLSKSGKGSLALLSATITLPEHRQVRFMTVHYALDKPTRLTQSEETLALAGGPLPVILTGDLNAEPWQEEITQLGKIFAFDGAPDALTYPDKGPVKKIDYVLASKEQVKTIGGTKVWEDVHYSDHLPVSAEITLK